MKKRKKLTLKRILKIIAGIIIFLTLPSLLFFGFLYFKYNEDLPNGVESEQADILAKKMLDALNYNAYKATDYLEWTFKNRHHFKWNKAENTCEVFWKNYKVNLDLENTANSDAFKNDTKIESEEKQALIKKATDYFNNDSFWLVAPYKVFDPGTKRSIVKHNNKDALLVKYNSGGTTPGDSYLWILDKDFKPTSYKMWVDILPIGGLESSWTDWKTTESGAQLPTFHKLLFLGLDMGEVNTIPKSGKTYYYPNTDRYVNSKNKVEIELDTFDNYNSLLNKIRKECIKEKTVILKYSDSTAKYKLIPIINCRDDIWCYKCRNELFVSPKGFQQCAFNLKPIDSLSKYLNLHYNNKGKLPGLSESTEKAFIKFYSNSSTDIKDVKATLIKLSNEHNRINAEHKKSFSLKIVFDNYNPHDINRPLPPKFINP